MPEFDHKSAFVTGGSRGVGRAVCLELARRGADVAFLYRSRDAEAGDTQAQIRALGRRALAIKADLADAGAVGAAIERATAEFGKLDVLVQAAGAMGAWREVAELATEEWDRYLAVDLSGAFYAIRAALPYLRRAGGGAIVAISSIAAQMCQARNVHGGRGQGGTGSNRPRGSTRGRAPRHTCECGGHRTHRHRHGTRRLRRMGP